jgi:hypothetical protein
MIRLLIIINFSLFGLLSNAQQTLFLEKIKNGNVKAINLPCEVDVKFKDGKSKTLLLQKISSDSFYFKKYYNQPENYDCGISSVEKIFVPKKGQNILYTAFVITTGVAVLVTPFAIFGPFKELSDASDPTRTIAIFFGIPVSAISIISSVIIASKFPKSYKTSKWRFYVK